MTEGPRFCLGHGPGENQPGPYVEILRAQTVFPSRGLVLSKVNRLLFAAGTEGVNQAYRGAKGVLLLDGDRWIEELRAQIVRTYANRERAVEAILKTGTSGPDELVDEAGNEDAGGGEVHSGFTGATNEELRVDVVVAMAHRIKDRATQVGEQVGATACVEGVERARVTYIELDAKVTGEIGVGDGLHAVHAETILRRYVCAHVGVGDTCLDHGSSGSDQRILRADDGGKGQEEYDCFENGLHRGAHDSSLMLRPGLCEGPEGGSF